MTCSRVILALVLMGAASAQTPPPAVAPIPPDAPDAPPPAVAPVAPLAPQEPLYRLTHPMPAPLPMPAVAPLAPQEPFYQPMPAVPFYQPMPAVPLYQPMPAIAPLKPFDLDFDIDVNINVPELQFQLDRAQHALTNVEPMLLAQQMTVKSGGRFASDDRLYESGQNALNNHRLDEALADFTQVASRGGSRADAGWYYKAYTLNKLGRRDEAIAAVAELRRAFPSSRWLDDAKALELQVKQESGRPVSPESESDEDLKLMALNGLMNSDPDRALPLVENVLKGSNSPRVKERALYVLAVNNSPKAQQTLEQIARGGGNPDLQLKAINYIGTMRRRSGNNTTPAVLPEIYASTSDLNVKRAILNVYVANHDNQHLSEVARSEKDPNLRRDAFAYLGNNVAGQPELWQIYQSETSPDVKEQILNVMYSNGDSTKLAEVARNEKDPKLRRAALRVLMNQRNAATPETLVSIYNSEQDQRNKKDIINTLHGHNNAKALVDIAKAEKDQQMKLYIVERLSNMKSKEASDYLEEILSK